MALNSKPTAAEDRSSDPSARGETAAQSFNDAYDDIPAAEKSTAEVLDAFLGVEPERDVARLIDGHRPHHRRADPQRETRCRT